MVMACRGWVQIGTSGIQIVVGWRGAIGACGWPWFRSPSSWSPSLRIGDFWLNGGVLVVVARHGAVGARGFARHRSPRVLGLVVVAENGSVLFFFFFFNYYYYYLGLWVWIWQ